MPSPKDMSESEPASMKSLSRGGMVVACRKNAERIHNLSILVRSPLPNGPSTGFNLGMTRLNITLGGNRKNTV